MAIRFKDLIDDLHIKYQELISMNPCSINSLPSNTPKGGVYLFSENGKHLYVGRTKRKIKDRVKDHISKSPDCPFAWHLAREKTGKKATYRKICLKFM